MHQELSQCLNMFPINDRLLLEQPRKCVLLKSVALVNVCTTLEQLPQHVGGALREEVLKNRVPDAVRVRIRPVKIVNEAQ